MEIEKIANWNDAELAQQERQAAEQLFRLRFQMRMGQNDGVQKLRGLKKDIARIKTIQRQRELGIVQTHTASAAAAGRAATETAEPTKATASAAKKTKAATPKAKKPAAVKRTTASAKAKPVAAKKPAGAKKTLGAKKGSR